MGDAKEEDQTIQPTATNNTNIDNDDNEEKIRKTTTKQAANWKIKSMRHIPHFDERNGMQGKRRGKAGVRRSDKGR